MAGMSGTDRRDVWIKLIVTLGAVALAAIGIFTVANTVGGSNNTCTGGVCGDHNSDNHVGASSSPTR